MAFQKTLTIVLQTADAQKMSDYVDLFIRGTQGDPTGMTTVQKTNYIQNNFFKYAKNIIKTESVSETLASAVLEDVNGNLIQV